MDSSDHGRPSPSLVFSLSDVTDGVDADLLRAVFLLSDVVVVIYRLTVTYVTVRALRRRFRRPSGHDGGPLAADSGSTLRSSSSRTALTSTSGPTVVPDTSNIYIDPQSLVVENCSTLLRRPVTGVDTASASCPRRYCDAKYLSGQRRVLSYLRKYCQHF